MLSGFSQDTRWTVFKVKERGINSMQTKLALSVDDKAQFAPVLATGEEISTERDYSFNWPYDFFSLIELVKIDANVTSQTKIDPKVAQAIAESSVGITADALQNAAAGGITGGIAALQNAFNGNDEDN